MQQERTTEKAGREKIYCPFCNGVVRKFSWGYACSNRKYKDPDTCQFFVARKIAGVEILDDDIRELISKGRTKDKSFISKKTGKKYRAHLTINEKREIVIEFATKPTKFKCPVCGSPIVKIQKGYKCSSEECGFILWEKIAGKKIPQEQCEKLLKTGKTDVMNDFLSSKESSKCRSFAAMLVVKPDGRIGFAFARHSDSILYKPVHPTRVIEESGDYDKCIQKQTE